jgi:hypothetical protein
MSSLPTAMATAVMSRPAKSVTTDKACLTPTGSAHEIL